MKTTFIPPRVVRLAVVLAAALPQFTSVCLQAGDLRVGAAAVDITPPPGLLMPAGYSPMRTSEGALDPLFAKTLVIESGGDSAALVILDVINLTRAITDDARAAIEQATGIPGAHVMVSATHTHTSPELVNRSRRGNDTGSRTPQVIEYTAGLTAKIAESARRANDRRQPAQLHAATGRCDDLTFNRRFFMRDGTVGWNPGKLNPNIMMPAGPTDPEVGLLYVRPSGAEDPRHALAVYVNFAMHPDTCGGNRFSADWPGALSRVLAGYHGTNLLTLLANGACGNLNHFDTAWAWPQNTGAEGHRIGTILGASVFQAYKDLKPVAAGPLRVRSEMVELELAAVAPKQLEAARQLMAVSLHDRCGDFLNLVRAYRVVELAEREGKPYRVEVQAVALGPDVAWISLPGEIFVELGLALKKRSPFPRTFIVELANDHLGYIPDRRSYAEGNYEAESARCAPGSGEKLVEVALRLLQQLKP